MAIRLFVVHGSHPCAAVEKALQLKGLEYKVVEWPPPMQAVFQKAIFGRRTVPGIQIDGEKLTGSRDIVRRLEELRPDPPLFPEDPEARAKVVEAERWGEEVLQPAARRILWPALGRNPAAGPSYTEGSRLPLPAPVARLSMPLIVRAEIALNQADDEAVRADLRALPVYLDRVDGWIADGVLGGEAPNAADLQIATSLRLLMTLDDLRPLIEARPAGDLALRLFPWAPGRLPAGALPPSWLPAEARAGAPAASGA